MGRRGRRANGMSAAPPATSLPRSPTGATGPPCAASSAESASCADLPIGRDRAPDWRPGPSERHGRWGLAGGLLTISGRRRLGGSPASLRRGLRGRSLRLDRDSVRGGCRLARRGGLGGGLASRVARQTCGVLVPVGLAHPPQTVLLAGLLREVLNRGVVGFDPEPRRADALSRVRHVRRPFACQPRSGVGAHIHHSGGQTMQGRRSGLAR